MFVSFLRFFLLYRVTSIIICVTGVIAGGVDAICVSPSKSSYALLYAVTITSNGLFVSHNFVWYILLYLKTPCSVFHWQSFLVLSMSVHSLGIWFTVIPSFPEPRRVNEVF